MDTKVIYRVVKQYADRSGITAVYEDTPNFKEALIARQAAQNATGELCFILAVDPDNNHTSVADSLTSER